MPPNGRWDLIHRLKVKALLGVPTQYLRFQPIFVSVFTCSINSRVPRKIFWA